MKKFSTKYGYFTEGGDEYVITDFRTPKPWINVISNGIYGLVVSQTGGGFSWNEHSEFNRLNRWHQDLIQDNWGKYFYIKNNDTGEIFSPAWMPVKQNLDFYECRFGLGYTKFTAEFKNIKVVLNLFIPFDDNLEIWNFYFENNTGKELNLSLYSYFEWCLGSSADHHREFHKTFIETKFDTELNCMTAAKRLWEIPLGDRGHWNIEYPYLAFLSSSKRIEEYEGDKESFIGQYGSINEPIAIRKGKLSNKTGKWNDSIGTIKLDLNILPAHHEETAVFIGLKKNKKEIQECLSRYSSKEKIDNALIDVKLRWEKILGNLYVETPDDTINILVNKWLRYQAISGRLWGRTAYYQQSGAYGFRDQLQDSLVFLTTDPSKTLEQIKLHARHQKEDGTVLHWWHPISDTGLETKMTDDLLWLPFVIFQYLDETNDYSILEIKEPYYNNSNPDSLFNHCKAAIEKVLTRLSKRGLPLIGAGDWNDGLSAVGLDMKGESIWLAEFFYLILKRFSSVCEKLNDLKSAGKYAVKAEELKISFNNHAWDGEWFCRATKDNGEKIGSKENIEGKIYLNAQTWSVISAIADNDQQMKAMDAVTKYLLKNNGTLLLSPAYTKPDKMIGYLSRYAPGRRENGGVYTHAAVWSIWAYSLINKPELAYEAYRRLCPINNGMDADKYCAEPFVTPGNIDGPDSPNYGMGGWTWYTGSAAWFQKVIVDFILGIKAEEQGLSINPCIIPEWESYNVKRLFRGSIYYFKINNTKRGKIQIIADGKEIEGNIIHPINKKEVQVIINL